MSTSVKTGRAWVPAIVTTLLAVVLLAGSGLLWEILDDQDVAGLRDPDSLVGTFVYAQMAPLGGPGIVGDREFADSIAQLGGGLVPVVVVVFLFTWLAARGGSSFGVLMGAWLGTVLGAGLGALVAFQVFVWQNDVDVPGVHQIRADRIDTGLYWGAVAGLLLGLVAMLARVVSRPRAEEPPPAAPDSAPPPPDDSSYPPPGKHQQPAGTPPPADETVRAPESTQEP
jgi:hypothetical protein